LLGSVGFEGSLKLLVIILALNAIALAVLALFPYWIGRLALQVYRSPLLITKYLTIIIAFPTQLSGFFFRHDLAEALLVSRR